MALINGGPCTTVGPRQLLVGPRPIPPRHSLLETPGIVVADSDGHWMNGANVIGFPDDLPTGWDPLTAGTYRTKGEGTDRPEATFDPFVVYFPVTCSVLGQADIRDQVEAAMAASISFEVERVVSQGLAGSSNPYFGDGDLYILAGGTAVPPDTALAYLEGVIGASGRGGALIHAPPQVVASFGQNVVDPNTLITPNGSQVISGGGYSGADPVDGASPLDDWGIAGATQAWVFATGPIEVRMSTVSIATLPESLDRSDNTVTYRAERVVLATWTDPVAGILVDWATCCGPAAGDIIV